MIKLRCLVVDDESLGRKLIEENISQVPFLEHVASCKNAFEAIAVLQEKEIDLIFLDIQMPGMLGTRFLSSLENPPIVIFVTAYPQYALEGFELNVVDYLMKPVSLERFLKAAYKAQKMTKPESRVIVEGKAKKEKDTSFFVNVEYSLVKISPEKISHIEGMKDYVKIFLTGQQKPVVTKATLKSLEEKLDSRSFMRVHKSYIANLEKVDSIRNHYLHIASHAIPVSESQMSELMTRIGYDSAG